MSIMVHPMYTLPAEFVIVVVEKTTTLLGVVEVTSEIVEMLKFRNHCRRIKLLLKSGVFFILQFLSNL